MPRGDQAALRERGDVRLRGVLRVRLRVLAARCATAEGDRGPPCLRRRSAESLAWRESAVGDAAVCGSRLAACKLARERRGFGFFPALAESCAALRFTR